MRIAVALQRAQIGRRVGCQVLVAAHDHFTDHAGQAHFLAVFRAVDAGHAVGLQLGNLRRHDHPAAAAKHLDVRATALLEQVHHVLEVLHVTALVRAQGNALHVFLQGGSHHLFHTAVVAQVNDLGAHALQDASHDVDGCVVPVKQTGRRDEAHFVRRAVVGQGLEFSRKIGHGGRSRWGCRWTECN